MTVKCFEQSVAPSTGYLSKLTVLQLRTLHQLSRPITTLQVKYYCHHFTDKKRRPKEVR